MNVGKRVLVVLVLRGYCVFFTTECFWRSDFTIAYAYVLSYLWRSIDEELVIYGSSTIVAFVFFFCNRRYWCSLQRSLSCSLQICLLTRRIPSGFVDVKKMLGPLRSVVGPMAYATNICLSRCIVFVEKVNEKVWCGRDGVAFFTSYVGDINCLLSFSILGLAERIPGPKVVISTRCWACSSTTTCGAIKIGNGALLTWSIRCFSLVCAVSCDDFCFRWWCVDRVSTRWKR